VAVWSVNVHALNNGTAIITGLPVMDFGFSYSLNGPGAFEARLPLRHSSVLATTLAPGEREIRVTRDGVLVWGGYLWGARVEMRDTVTIRAEGYLSRLRRRFVMSDLIYTDVAQQTLAWNLINHTQTQTSGDMLLTQGAHAGSSILRDADWCALDHPNVAAEIEAFSEFDTGIDFEITPSPDSSVNKSFKTYQPKKGTDRTGTVIFTETNTSTLSYELNGDSVISRLVTTGNGDCNPPEDDRSDATALTNFGLLQEYVSVDTGKFSEVAAHGAETLKNFKQTQRLAQIEYPQGSGAAAWNAYVVGDTIRLNSTWGPTNGFGKFDVNMRVLAFEVFCQGHNTVFYRALLDSVTS
jgi:hypothetical protein